MDTATDILARYWGYSSFRPLQHEVIDTVLQGHDTLALMPTGGGKSLCFQVPAMMLDGICVVVSPLIALMNDQVESLKNRGIPAATIVSGMNRVEVEIVLNNCVYGKIKILYVSPERLKNRMFIEHFKQMRVSLIAVDEAHCISQWGYDFRPPYLDIAEARRYHPTVPVVALTATATANVVEDIKDKLGFGRDSKVFRKSFYRSNLVYMVFREEDKYGRLLRIIRKVRGSGIVYVRNRRRTQEVAQYLASQGVTATYYNAGMPAKDRDKHQQRWHEGKVEVIVATNAFGMGIDKQDVRYVVHLDLPETIEAYFQEAGRAGRDERLAYAVMLYNQQDIDALEEGLENSYPTMQYIRNVYKGVCNYFKIPMGAGCDLAFDFDIAEICDTYRFKVLPFVSSLKFLEKEGLLSLPDRQDMNSKVYMMMNKQDLYAFQVDNARYDVLIKLMLRLYGGMFTDFVPISEVQIAKLLHYETAEVEKMLKHLEKMQVIVYQQKSDKAKIIFTSPRVDVDDLYLKDSNYKALKQRAVERKNAMVAYATATTHCRSRLLLDYFEEKTDTDCGRCDACIGNRKKSSTADVDEVKTRIVEVVGSRPMNVRQVVECFSTMEESHIVETVRSLLEYEVLYQDQDMVLHISKKK